MTLGTTVRALSLAVTAMCMASCGGSSSPSSPSPAPAPAPSPAPPSAAVVVVSYAPSPVPYAGASQTTTCSASPNAWRFTTNYVESGGVAVTLTSVVTTLDGVAQAPVAVSIVVPARGSLANSAEICFPTSTQHTLRHAFTGVDGQGRAVSVTGPELVLLAK